MVKQVKKRVLACLLALLMLATSLPLSGISDDLLPVAEAADLSGYNAIAAAEWAKSQVGTYSSVLFGKRYWYEGGDCANFVSEAIYMGGIDPNALWNHQGWHAHFSESSSGSWIRAQELFDYTSRLSGKVIRNPSASQVEVGDLIFFKQKQSGGIHHSSIVVAADGKNVSVAAHSVNRVAYIDSNWHLGFSNECTYLVKMNGATCTDQVVRSFDVYKANGSPKLYKSTDGRVGISDFLSGEYAHIYQTKKVNGVNWGYTFRYGRWGWVKLAQFTYQRHVTSGPVNHIMGDWYVKVQPTCSTVGVEERVCSRCGYKETREMAIGGAHKNVVAATCLSPSYCTACGEILSPALGHDWDEWNTLKAPTCLSGGTEKRDCFRCGLRETRAVGALGHNYEAVVALPGCTTSGTTTYQCTRCQDSYIENASWSGYSVINTSDPQYAEFLNNPDLSRSRTEYRYRTKSTAKRYNTTGTAPVLSGYTLEGTTWSWNAYGSWSNWSTTKATGSDYRQVETKQEHTGYNLLTNCYHRIGDTYGRYYTNFYLGGEDAEGDQNRLDHGYTADYWQPERYRTVTIAQLNAATKVAAGADSPDSPNNYRGKNDTSVTGYWMSDSENSSNYRIWFIGSNAYTTYYRYRDRTKQYTYTYYKWSDWSSWSPTAQTASSTKEVQTRTTYSFKQSVLGHNWDDGTVVAPTCLEGGYTLYTCLRCGTTMKTNETAALGHDLRDDWYVFAEEGLTTTYRRDCHRNCGYYELKSETGCLFLADETVAPTCTEDGYTVYRCQTHPSETYKADIVPALGHECSEQWVVTKAPTCTEKGEEQCYCVRHDDGTTCDKVYTREIEAVGHDLVKTEAVAMTCEKDGCAEYYTCKNCNMIFADAEAATPTTLDQLRIPASGHNRLNADGEEVWVVEQASACGVTGRERLYCQNEHCDETYVCESCGGTHHALLDEREIAEITPNYILVYHKEPTCYAGGYDEYSCLNCIGTDHEHGYTEILGLAEHTWGDWEVDVEPLCIYEGDEKRTCTVCGETEYRELPAPYDTHDFETITLSPSCTSGGESYQKCKRCGYEEGKEDIDPTGHDIVLDTENSWAPTCEEPGVNHYICTRGDYEYDEYIDPIGHDYQLTGHTDATCLEPGMNVYTCTHDASHTYEEIDENEPALGHEMGEWYTIREANYAQTRIDQCDCIRGDYSQTRELPKLDRPVEENDAIETDKTVSYNPETGEATITLKTWSEAEKLVQQESFAMPLDIVLVVDQSGSMEGSKLRSLKSAAKEFIDTVYEDARERNVDHRIAIAGFAVGNYTKDRRNYPAYTNTVLFTGENGTIKKNLIEIGDGNYESALLSVNDNGSLNRTLANTPNQFQAKGATAADQGLEMACNIFSVNPVEDNNRQRIVVIMTDGEPTKWSGYDKDTANAAIEKAYALKNTYDAAVYSIGFMSDTENTNRFLTAVSSNYPEAKSVNRLGSQSSDAYFKKANAVDELSAIFQSIAVETTEYYTNFKNLTLIDTVSAYFTLTTAQETKLREDAMKQLGVRNEDITVTRHQNGTTTIQISGINPKQVIENGKVIYRTEFSFTVSADGDALTAGTYHTNEDDSGVSLDGESFASKFSSPTVTLDTDRGAAIFAVNGEPYQIVSVEIGGEVEAPVYTIDNSLKWDVPAGYTLSGGTVTFNAESSSAHAHTYEAIVLEAVDCGNDGVTEYLCDCGVHYIETIPATGEHHWQVSRVTGVEGEFTTTEFLCTVCGDPYYSQHLYEFVSEELATGREADTAVSVTEELRFGHTDDDARQPDGEVTIIALVGDYFNLATLQNINVYRVEADGSRTKLPASYEDGVVTFTTDHFCQYIYEAVYQCQNDGSHYDTNQDGYCDDCGTLVSEWYAFRCKMCATYEKNKDVEIIGIFYRLVHFFVHMAHLIGFMT